MNTVVVTRPLAQASALATAITTAGYVPLIFPAIDIAAVADTHALEQALAQVSRYQLVIFVSPNAIAEAFKHLPQAWPREVAIGVMGPGSVDALAQHGIDARTHCIYVPGLKNHGDSHETTRYDSESLLHQLDQNIDAGQWLNQRVLIVKGNGGRPWLAEQLMARGAQVDQVESYRRSRHCPEAAEAAALQALIATDTVRATTWIVTSSEAVGYLCASLEEVGGAVALAWLKACRWIVPHQRIAENATAVGITHIVLSGAGDSNIIQALK